jgi:hypothetical protein
MVDYLVRFSKNKSEKCLIIPNQVEITERDHQTERAQFNLNIEKNVIIIRHTVKIAKRALIKKHPFTDKVSIVRIDK